MNASLRVVVLSLSVAALGACASMDERSTSVAESSKQVASIEQDQAYIARVEQIARRRGVYLQWVNPPTKRSDANQQ